MVILISRYELENLKLYDIYEDDAKRLLWVSFTAKLGAGEFHENEETGELLFFSPDSLPVSEMLRGPLTERLLRQFIF